MAARREIPDESDAAEGSVKKRGQEMTMRLLSWVFFAILAASPLQAAAAEAQPVAVAIADFDNFDTTGEDAERTAAHAARVKAFTDLLRQDLAGDGSYGTAP
jgi:hypothetical protein